MPVVPHRHLTGAARFCPRNGQLISAIGLGLLGTVLCLGAGCQANESSQWSAQRKAMNEFQKELQKDAQEAIEDLSAAFDWLLDLGEPFISH